MLTSAEKTGSPALTIWPNETEPAFSASTDAECAAAEQKATGSILTRSEAVIFGGACFVGAAKPQHGRKL